jgi:class 3 adenylate cyclase/tetratricopeptide (TPR) repeat protein
MELNSPETRPPISERRYLTVVFVDLVGYTRLSAQLDTEDLRVLLRRYQTLALRVMERFGGFVARYIGDGILVYFGYPIAHENDAERAIRAALELIERLRGLDTTVRDTTMPPLVARIGISTGLALIAPELLSGGASEHNAIGDVVNLAARFQAEAPPSGVVISRETFDLVEGRFECAALGSRPIKGLPREVGIYQVIRSVPLAKRAATRKLRSPTRMVGRKSAMECILSQWKSARSASQCRTVAVVGEAGIGKTRLVQEFCGRSEMANATIVQLNCHELFASSPLYPVASFFWARAGMAADDDVGAQIQKISNLLDELGSNSPENKQLVANLAGLATPGAIDAAAPTPLLFKRKQYDFVISLIERTARAQSTLLWIEDAHWLDPSSAELLVEIVASLTSAPLLVLLTHRSFPKGPALPQPDETVHLERLEKQDCLEIAKSLPGADRLSNDVIARAIEAAEGIPLFLEQFIKSLADERLQTPGRVSRPSGVPLMLGEMMSERLDRLPGGRRVVQAAACIGRSFTLEFLASLLDKDPPAIAEPLQALVQAEILLPRRYGAEIRYDFSHALLQRIAYESIVQTERSATHERIVDVLRRGHEPDPTLADLTAHHLTEAGKYRDAIGEWLQAGLSAARRSAHVEAIALLRRGLGLLDKISDATARRQLELGLQAALIGSIMAAEGATSIHVSECCKRGLELCREGESTPLVLAFAFGQFTFTNCRGRVDDAASLARLFLSLAESNGSESGRVIGHRMLGTVLLGQGDAVKAREHLELSLRLYSAERDGAATHQFGQNTEVHTKSSLSLVHFCLGNIDLALAVGIDALRSADALRHPHSTAIPLTYVGGWVFGLCEATDQMMHEAERLRALAEQHRLTAFHAHGTGLLGWALCQQGQLARGAAAIEEAIAALDSIEFRLAISGFLGNLADAQRRLGNLQAAETACARAIESMGQSSYLWLEPELRRIEALISRELFPRKPERAVGMLRSAVRRAQELGFPVFERRCLVTLKQCAAPDDFEFESRLRELSHLGNLPERVASAMQASQSPS